MHYPLKQFTIPALRGISEKQIAEHLTLYAGYVTHINKIHDEVAELSADFAKNGHLIQELQRRKGFEFNGMRLHEYYFGDLEGGSNPITADMRIYTALTEYYGTFGKCIDGLTKGISRGSGWILLHYDEPAKCFHTNWVENHHDGHLATLPIILAIDMWEHAYMVDYMPGEKMKYATCYLDNLNWKTVDARFCALVKHK